MKESPTATTAVTNNVSEPTNKRDHVGAARATRLVLMGDCAAASIAAHVAELRGRTTPRATASENENNPEGARREQVNGGQITVNPLDPRRQHAAVVIQRNFRKRRFVGYITKVAAQCRNKRSSVIELRTTELDYIAHLLELRETFQMPLVTHNLLEPEKIDWKSYSQIGNLLCDFVTDPQFFEAYRSFICRFEIIQRHVDLYYQTEKPFREYVDSRISSTMGSGKQYLQSLLITIVQRLPRYQLLARDLLKYTYTEHSDTVTLKKAVETLREITSNINRATGKDHDWAPITFPSPGWCRVCDQRLLGFGLRGIKCLACNIVVHKECCGSQHLAPCPGHPESFNGALLTHVATTISETHKKATHKE
ncbi:hypothetical protein Pelo_14177 [Pelomyxa schiedti]|nr:hypothetical protein Pelo_14177 [Pelomyxa schiedti]